MRSLPKHRSLLTFCAVTTLLFPFGATTPAGAKAQTLDATPSAEVVTDLETLAQQALTLEEVQDEGSHYQISTEEAQIEIPKNSVEPITLSQNDGEDVYISLPFSSVGDQAEEGEYGEISYEHVGLNASSSVLPRDDGSVQMVTTIESSSAPQEYAYQLDLPQEVSLQLLDDGGFLALNADGSIALGAAAPWAKDANGKDLPTHYEIRGSSLVQVVEHQNHSDVSYPVTADPFWGRNLFHNLRVDWYSGDLRYNGSVTPWGALVLSGGGGIGGHLIGQKILNDQGWAEWRNRFPRITNKATLRHQYECHVAAGVYGLPFTGEYNLERFRGDRSFWWMGVVHHRCNW